MSDQTTPELTTRDHVVALTLMGYQVHFRKHPIRILANTFHIKDMAGNIVSHDWNEWPLEDFEVYDKKEPKRYSPILAQSMLLKGGVMTVDRIEAARFDLEVFSRVLDKFQQWTDKEV